MIKLIYYTHWSTAVTTPYIYETFMNHLETEFSVENLLFITEYVQIKQVLMIKYPQSRSMMKENALIKFDIKLPQNNTDCDYDYDEKNSILEIEMKQSNPNSNRAVSVETPPTMHVSRIAKQLCQDSNVIITFRSLYNKYVDENNAPFMINVSSICREELIKSLDCNYYQDVSKTNTTNHQTSGIINNVSNDDLCTNESMSSNYS